MKKILKVIQIKIHICKLNLKLQVLNESVFFV